MDYSLPGCSVHRILQARILEGVAVPFSRGSFQPRSPTLQADSLPSEPPGKPKNIEDMDKISKLDLFDVLLYKSLHPANGEYSFLSTINGAFTQVD